MSLEELHKDHFINQLEALQKNLSKLISASKVNFHSKGLLVSELFNLSDEIFCVLDLSGRFLCVNAGFSTSLGYDHDQVINQQLLDFTADPDKKVTHEYLNKLALGFPLVKFKFRFKCAGNALKQLEWKGIKKEEYIYLVGKEEEKTAYVSAKKHRLPFKETASPAAGDFFTLEHQVEDLQAQYNQLLENKRPAQQKTKAAAMNTAGTNGVITFVNDHWLEELGYERDEIAGKECFSFFDIDAEEDILKNFIPALEKTGKSGPFEGMMIKKDGGRIKVSYSGSGSTSHIHHWIIFFKEEIAPSPSMGTEKKETEPPTIKETDPSSEQNLRAIINSSKQILFLIDKDLKIIAFNKHAQAIVSKKTGKDLSVGDSFLNFIPRLDIDSFKEIFNEGLNGKVIHLTRELRFKNALRWFEIHIQPVEDDVSEVKSVVFSAEDITNRKIAEEKFRELEINFKSIFSQVAVGIMLFNIDLDIEQANRRFYEMVEYSVEEYKKLGPIGVTHPEDRENSNKKAEELIAGKVDHYSIEKRYVTKSGKIIWAYLTATLVRNRHGKPKHIISVIQDITGRKTAEQELLYKKNELDTFVYRASHDLRGPVASLMGLYNIVKKEFVDNEQALSYFQHYNNSVMRLHAVLQNLIDLTKIKDSETKLSQVDIKEMIDSCLDSLNELPNFNRIKLFIEIDLDFKVFIDGKKFKTIIKNLVENSIMYCTPEDKAFIKIIVSCQENVLKTDVIDNGRGIHPNIQSKVFNMFFRGTEVSSGSGLGLYIVKNAVEKLNGSIQLSSQLNEGTKVSVYIPYLYEQEYTALLEKNFVN